MTKDSKILDELWKVINEREQSIGVSSYTREMLEQGINKIAQKLGEEASELIIATLAETKKEVVGESADLLYHWLLLLKASGVEPSEVYQELANRRK
jgi:phosphoribosyl-ATP pyrophosphohydrolase|tara:strand:- start:3975 stop:4265 length:291 start_codon:yes stop_codon:yes gene_type:complete